jgi:hypothetical protein
VKYIKTALIVPIMLCSMTSSVFAEDSGERVPFGDHTPISINSTIFPNELTVVGGIGLFNLQKNVTVSRDYAASEKIPEFITYSEDNGSQGRWGGKLYRTNNPAPQPLIGGGLRVYFTGTVYKDIN